MAKELEVWGVLTHDDEREWNEESIDAFLDAFIEFIEARGVLFGGVHAPVTGDGSTVGVHHRLLRGK